MDHDLKPAIVPTVKELAMLPIFGIAIGVVLVVSFATWRTALRRLRRRQKIQTETLPAPAPRSTYKKKLV